MDSKGPTHGRPDRSAKRSMLKCGISVNFLPIKKLNTGSDTVKFPNALQGSQCLFCVLPASVGQTITEHSWLMMSRPKTKLLYFICDLPTKESVPRSTRYLLGDFDGPWIP